MTGYSEQETAAHRAEWVAALRSGEYQQTTGRLRRGENFCCLGVACEVAGKHGITRRVGDGYAAYPEDGWPNSSDLPYEVQRWLGLDSPAGALVEMHAGKFTLDGLNDAALWGFKQIADVIEAGKVKLAEVDSREEGQ